MRKEEIRKKIQEKFRPEFLEIIDKSEAHQGHLGNNGGDGTHLTLKIAASELGNLTRIQAHREINNLLAGDFETGLHALEIVILKSKPAGN